jgi:hypothetical protein
MTAVTVKTVIFNMNIDSTVIGMNPCSASP